MRSITLAAALAVIVSLSACSELVLKRGQEGGVDVGFNGVGASDDSEQQYDSGRPVRRPPRHHPKKVIREVVREHRTNEDVSVRDHRLE